jgi:retron-type reverse transcriptase
MIEKAWENFVSKETNGGRLPEGKRKYLHFDRKINFSSSLDFLKGFLSDSKNVAQKSFYPFLRNVLKTPRYKYDEDLGKRKIDNKEREICYAAHFDSLVFSYYATILDRKYEDVVDNKQHSDAVIAYRKLSKNNIHFAKEVFDFVKKKGKCGALAFDITGFFDNLNHVLLKRAWIKILGDKKLPGDHYNLFKTLTKFSYVDREDVLEEFKIDTDEYSCRICSPHQFRNRVRGNGLIQKNPNSFGIPQGSPMSAILSNIYMYEFDKKLLTLINDLDGFYRRYSDDILLVVDIKDVSKVENFFYTLTKEFELESKKEKEKLRFFREEKDGLLSCYDENEDKKPLQYLGFIFDGKRTLIRSSSISRYYRKMRNNVREAVKKTLGKGTHSKKVSKRKLYNKFTHKGAYDKGDPNFITYVYKAAEIMDERAIRAQVRNHVKKLNEAIEEKYELRQKNKNL